MKTLLLLILLTLLVGPLAVLLGAGSLVALVASLVAAPLDHPAFLAGGAIGTLLAIGKLKGAK